MAKFCAPKIGHDDDAPSRSAIEPGECDRTVQAARVVVDLPALEVLLVPAEAIRDPVRTGQRRRRVVVALGHELLWREHLRQRRLRKQALPRLGYASAKQELQPEHHVVDARHGRSGCVCHVRAQRMCDGGDLAVEQFIGAHLSVLDRERIACTAGAHAYGRPETFGEEGVPALPRHPLDHEAGELVHGVLVDLPSAWRCDRCNRL